MRSIRLPLGLLLPLLAVGCGSSDGDRVSALEKRIADLEKEVAELRAVEAPAAAATETAAYHPTWSGVTLDPSVEKGLDWLVSAQGNDGGWGQDGGHDSDARDGVKIESTGNDVANTAMACLALMRAGTTPGAGKHCAALNKGIEFILAHVENAPADGIRVTNREGTQIQRKLGPDIDTFLANLVLAEADGTMGGVAADRRVREGLTKCVAKIEKHQGEDGSWSRAGGWAPVISTSMASRSLYRAQTKGVTVNGAVMDKVEEWSGRQFDDSIGSFTATSGAGVELYTAAQALENNSRTPELSAKYADANGAAVAKLSSDEFVGGFGSMGGEEFVSYMNISDSLIRTGGEEWKAWNGKIKDHLVKLQNQDGTWAGHHCITGRVACTSAAVMTLLTERSIARAE